MDERNATQSNRRQPLALFFLALLAALVCGGCKRSASTYSSPPADTRAPLTADQLMQRMIHSYHDMPRYSDRAVLRVAYTEDGQTLRDEAPMSVRFERPNLLRFSVYQTQFVCDGRRIRAVIVDPPSRNLDGQLLDLPAPEKLTTPIVYGDPLLHEFIREGLAGYPVQLDLLLGEQPLKPVLDHRDSLRRLGDDMVDGHLCHGVAASVGPSQYVFWIDPREFILRRLEFPSDDPNLQLTIDYLDANFDDRFAAEESPLTLPAEPKLVRAFVVPVEPLPTGEFSLAAADGATIRAADLRGKTTVLVWFQDHEACRDTLQQLQRVADQFASDAPVRFLAVYANAEDADSRLRELAAEWKIRLELAVDRQATGRDVFQIHEAPTLIVLDSEGQLQIRQPRANPNLEVELPTILKKLNAGEQVPGSIVDQHREDVARYRQQLAVAMQPSTAIPVAADRPTVAEAFAPQRLSLKPVWKNNELIAPGNVAVDIDESSTPLLVLDGWRTVVEIDSRGDVAKRQSLELPTGSGVNRVSVRRDEDGRRFVLMFATMGKQAYLFDHNWQLVWGYPPEDEMQPGVLDADLFVGPTGALMAIVALERPLGLHVVGIDGTTAWTNRVFESAASIAVDHSTNRIVVTNPAGEVLPLDITGRHDPRRTVSGWPIVQLRGRDEQVVAGSDLCGLSNGLDGRPVAVALDYALNPRWTYPLPPAIHETAVERIVATDLLDRDGEWVFPGADGTIHLVTCDGEFSDHWGIGTRVHGLAGIKVDGQSLLVVSSESGIECVRVALPSE